MQMTEDDRKVLKGKLEGQIPTLTSEIEELKELTKPIAPENAIGRISRMDAINNRSVNIAALQKAEIRLRALKDALSNVDQAEFGICVRCKSTIPIGRLLLRPQSKSCVNCAH